MPSGQKVCECSTGGSASEHKAGWGRSRRVARPSTEPISRSGTLCAMRSVNPAAVKASTIIWHVFARCYWPTNGLSAVIEPVGAAVDDDDPGEALTAFFVEGLGDPLDTANAGARTSAPMARLVTESSMTTSRLIRSSSARPWQLAPRPRTEARRPNARGR